MNVLNLTTYILHATLIFENTEDIHFELAFRIILESHLPKPIRQLF
jgi:hypothetical protein